MTCKVSYFCFKAVENVSPSKHKCMTTLTGHLACHETYQETVDILWPSHQHSEIAKLFRQGQEHLIFVIDGV